jgi:hypothetical protein
MTARFCTQQRTTTNAAIDNEVFLGFPRTFVHEKNVIAYSELLEIVSTCLLLAMS